MVKVEGLTHLCFLIFVTVSWLGACPACGACPRPCTCYLPTEVHCTFRYLTSIPDGFPPHVERVNLGYNSLVKLAETDFSGLSRLEMLLLHSNGIHTIPDKTFSDLGALQVLKLSYNKVRRLQRDAFYGLSNLTRLHLDHNGLEFINPQAFYGLTALRVVQLEGNRLTRLHADTFVTLRYLEVFRTSSIRYLHLSDNLLSSLPREMLSSLSSLESLYLHGNPWTCDCHLSWLAGWTLQKPDVIKCKKDRNPSNPPQCPLCTNPRTAQGQLLARVPAAAFLCAPPALEGSAGDRSLNAGPWGAPEPISPQDFTAPWGSLALNLTDQAGNEAAVVCSVEKPGDTSSTAALAAENSSVVLDVAFTVSLACDLAEGHLLAVWQILAPYSDAPLLLERNRALPEVPGDPYWQVVAGPDDTFTGVQATLRAQPTWLLQARVSLWLDRAATTPQAAWLRWSSRARFRAPSPEPEPGPWTLILSERRAQRERTVLAGRTVALDCPGLGHPTPRLEWLLADGSRVGAPHTSGDGRVLVHRDGTLEMRAADTSDTGAYRCVSTASHDTDVLTYWVTVVEAPGDTPPQGRPPQVVFLDEPLDLPCGVTTGSPDPRISWVLPGAVVLPGPATDRHVLNNGTLRIARVTRRDQGIYRCVAANPLGVDVLTYRVAVRIQGPREPFVETEGSGLGTPYPPPVPRPAPALRGAETGRPVGGQRRGRFWEQRRQRLPSVRRIDPRHWAALLEKARRRDQPGAPGSPPGNAPVRKTQRLTTAPREEESSGLAPLGEEEVVLATTASRVDPDGPRKILDRPPTKIPMHTGGSPLRSALRPPPGKPIQFYLPGATASAQPFPTSAASTWPSATHLESLTPGFFPGGGAVSSRTGHTEGRDGLQGGSLGTAGMRFQAGRVRGLPGGTKGHGPTHPPPSPSAAPSGWAHAAQSQAHPSWSHSTPGPRRRIWGPRRTPAGRRHPYGLVRPRLKGTVEGNISVWVAPKTNRGCPSCIAAEPVLPSPAPGQPPKAVPDGVPPAPVSDRSLLWKDHPEGQTTETLALEDFSTPWPQVITRTPTSTAVDESPATPTVPPGVAGLATVRREAFVTPARPPRPAKPSVTTARTTRGKVLPRQGSARGPSPREGLRAQHRPGGQKVPASVPPSTAPAGPSRHAAPLQATRLRPLVTQAPSTAPSTHVAQPHPLRLRPPGKALSPPALDPTAPRLWSPESSDGPLHMTMTTAVPQMSKVDAAQTDGTRAQISEREMEWRGEARVPRPSPDGGHSGPTSKTTGTLAGLTPAGKAVPSVPVSTQAPWGSTEGTSSPTGQHPRTQSPGQEPGRMRALEETGEASASVLPSWERQSTPARNSSLAPSLLHLALGPGDPLAPTTPSSSPWGHPSTPPASWVMTTAYTRVKVSGSSRPRWDPEQLAPERVSSTNTGPGPTSFTLGMARTFHSQPPFHPVALLVQPTPPPHFGETQSGPQPDTAATEAKGLGSTEVTTLTPNWPGQQKAEDGSSRETPARKSTPALGPPVNPRSRNLFERPRMVGGRAASYTVLAHSDAFLPCAAVGNPPPTLRWTRVSSGLVLSGRKEGSRFQVLDNGTLSIRSVDVQDRGQYLCSASNAFGSDHLYVTLSVVSYPPRMLESLAEELLVHSGSTLALPCRADGRPRPSIAWTLPNQTVVVPEFSDGAGRAQVTQEGSLVLRDLGVPDQGFYRCTASNVAGQDWLQVKVQVIATPPFILEPKRQVVAGTWGHSLRLPCTATGVPLPGVRWVLPDGSEVGPLQPAPPKLLLFANGTLQVSDLASSEQGTYRCLATSPAGSDARLVLVTVEPLGTPPKIHVASPTWTEVDLGGRLRLDCSATGQPQPQILWRLPSKAVVEEQHRMGSRIHVYSNGSLAIDAAADKDEGDYLCVARNPSGEDLVSMHVGLRREAARISGEPLLSQQVRQGGAFRVDCPASGAPPPDISWVLPDGSVARARPGGRHARGLTLFANGTLHLSGVGVAEQGDYTCRAQNPLGRDEMRVRLTVVPAAPRIQPGAAPAPRVQTGDTAVLDCEVAGEPPPTRFWLLPSGLTVAASRGRYALHANGSLAVSRVTPRDGGAYVCVARNPAGSDARTYRLHVQDAAAPGPVRRATAGRHSRALLPCAPGATWLLPGAVALRAPYHGGRLSVHANGSLEIRNVRPSDAAEFVCVAPGQRALAVRLDVLEPARRPSFRSPAHEKVVARLGRPTALHCAADGHPPPDILWVLPNGTRLPGAGPAGNASLVIPRTARSHAGRYRCTARNAAGYVEKLVVVEVSQRPVILTPALGGVFGLWGEPLWLHCVSDGSPKPRLAWTVPPGAVLERPGPQGPYVLHENGTLVIRAAEARDTGSYVCQARNSAGRAHIAVPVTVVAYAPRITRRPPRSVLATTGTAVRLSCGALGVPRPLITWEGPAGPPLPRARRGSAPEPVTQPGTLVLHDPQTEDSGTYTCTARNSLGSDSAATFLRVI